MIREEKKKGKKMLKKICEECAVFIVNNQYCI